MMNLFHKLFKKSKPVVDEKPLSSLAGLDDATLSYIACQFVVDNAWGPFTGTSLQKINELREKFKDFQPEAFIPHLNKWLDYYERYESQKIAREELESRLKNVLDNHNKA